MKGSSGSSSRQLCPKTEEVNRSWVNIQMAHHKTGRLKVKQIVSRLMRWKDKEQVRIPAG